MASQINNTKFWFSVGVEVALLLVLLLLVLTDKIQGHFEAWLIAFVGLPVQYGVFNVISSAQAVSSTTTTDTPGKTVTVDKPKDGG